MLKSTLAAGLFLAAFNILPFGTPVAHAAGTLAPAVAPQPADVADGGPTLTAAESEFITRINVERTARGENALVVDPLLETTARAHSREMCELNYFDHHSPTPGMETPLDRYLKGLHDTCAPAPSYLLVGENIYYCSTFNAHYDVEYSHQSLMHSPGHRANILEPRFTKIGVGVYQDANGEFWVTQMFMTDKP